MSMPEMSLEEQALRHADEFFTGPEKWAQRTFENDEGGICIGRAFINFLDAQEGADTPTAYSLGTRALGMVSIIGWNDTCPNFAALKAHLRSRIEYYQNQRLSQSYLVIIGPGRRVKS